MFEHLTDDALLLLASEQLSKSFREVAHEHLKHCDQCQLRLDEVQKVRSIWAGLSDVGLANALRSVPLLKRKPSRHEIKFLWAPVSALLAGPLIVLIVLMIPKTVPTASAHELLVHAIQSDAQTGGTRAFIVSVGGKRCAAEANRPFALQSTSNFCTEASGFLHRTPWGSGNPLSPRTFLDWHDSLSDRHDTVSRQGASWRIETLTSTGSVREASLTMRSVDYRPLSLELTFDNQQQIAISEDTETPVLAADLNVPDVGRHAPGAIIDDPADMLEIHAWQVLQDLNADFGWEANVIRDGERVIVKASVRDEARKREFSEAFQRFLGVELDVRDYRESPGNKDFLAARTLNADSLPLALGWLQQNFPDQDARTQFVNNSMELSKAVLGRAFMLQQLEYRQRVLRRCSCSTEFSKLIHHETILLQIAQKNMILALQPLVGALPQQSSQKLLSYEDARRLDTALGDLLASSSSQRPTSYEESMQIVRHLLFRKGFVENAGF